MSDKEDSIKALIIALFLFMITIAICLIFLIIFPRYIFLQLKKRRNALPSEKKKASRRWVPCLSPLRPEEPDIELGELQLNLSAGGDAVQRSRPQAGEHDIEMGELPLKYPDVVTMKSQQHPGDLPLNRRSESMAIIESAPDNTFWDIDLEGSTTQYPKDWPLSRSEPIAIAERSPETLLGGINPRGGSTNDNLEGPPYSLFEKCWTHKSYIYIK